MKTIKVNYNGKIVDFISEIDDEQFETNDDIYEDLDKTLLFSIDEVSLIRGESVGDLDD